MLNEFPPRSVQTGCAKGESLLKKSRGHTGDSSSQNTSRQKMVLKWRRPCHEVIETRQPSANARIFKRDTCVPPYW